MTAETRSRSVAPTTGDPHDRGHGELTFATGDPHDRGHGELTFATGVVEVWWTGLEVCGAGRGGGSNRAHSQTMAAREWVRETIATRLGLAPGQVGIVKDRHGKPHLRGAAAPAISVSHCDGFVALAVGALPGVGIDIEPACRVPRAGAIERLLSAQERATLVGLSPGAHARALLGYWTLRESAAKALGTGLGADLPRLEIVEGPDGPRLRDQTLGHIELRRWRPTAGVIGAVAVLTGLSPDTVLTGSSSIADFTGRSADMVLTGLSPDTVLTGSSSIADFTGRSAGTVLAGLSPDMVLTGLSPDTVLTGLSPDTVLTGSSAESSSAVEGM